MASIFDPAAISRTEHACCDNHGRRVAFQPYPTPLFDASGELTGAINLLVDITAARRRDEFLAHAQRCRRLCRTITDPETISTLRQMAERYELTAPELAASAQDSCATHFANRIGDYDRARLFQNR